MPTHWTDDLRRLGACAEAIEWAAGYDTLEAAWSACRRGDWMLWLLGRTCKCGDDQHRGMVLAACACARLALPHVPEGEPRPLVAIETAERWARGEDVTIEAVRAATYSAYSVYSTYSAYRAAVSAYSAALSVFSAATAAFSAASRAAYSAALSADRAAYSAALSVTLGRCADIVRERVPAAPEEG
jgi:hypothetical protein